MKYRSERNPKSLWVGNKKNKNMWELLANVQQLAVGSQLKQRNSYVEPINETIFNVDYIGEHYFTIRSIKQNNVDIDVDDQIIFNYKIGIIPFVEFMIELSN